ncbi:unnamed protein product [Mycena citricolor]|uniref:Uncharacterized protein n=1 Tax=Mycena citricolor TaxID=2018698 RepID=A0AAD2Q3D3_9AGAR|nr:unnamed protein product [Mycena citricolor]
MYVDVFAHHHIPHSISPFLRAIHFKSTLFCSPSYKAVSMSMNTAHTPGSSTFDARLHPQSDPVPGVDPFTRAPDSPPGVACPQPEEHSGNNRLECGVHDEDEQLEPVDDTSGGVESAAMGRRRIQGGDYSVSEGTATMASGSASISASTSTSTADSITRRVMRSASISSSLLRRSLSVTRDTKQGSAAPTNGAGKFRRHISNVFGRLSAHAHGNRARKHTNSSFASSSSLPTLPAELWMLILEFSTYPNLSAESVPPLDIPSSFRSPALTPASLGARLVYYRSLMAHKRALSLVCRAWHVYAQPVLYTSIWISRSRQARALAQTLLCGACCLSPQSPQARGEGPGRFIRRLHIETSTLERCDVEDLRRILDYAPCLEVYSDYRSVRRVMAGVCIPKKKQSTTPDDLFESLAHGGGLRRLSWTSYDDPTLVGLGVGLGRGVAGQLEYLELNFVSSTVSSSIALTTVVPNAGLQLPALRTLKVTLDNATFAVLSTWGLPALQNLSVVSADFSYASEGFRRFFTVHGKRLRQLELGHGYGVAGGNDETWVTPRGANGLQLSLAAWCPDLDEFICSADAEWNWQHPDWIAPHTLLPSHPNVSFIGIRGIDKRMWEDRGDDTFFGLREQVESLLRREAFPRLKYVRDMSEGSDRMRKGLWGSDSHPVSKRERQSVVNFWAGVLKRCREEGVWLEEWCGVNITNNTLLRAEAHVNGQ